LIAEVNAELGNLDKVMMTRAENYDRGKAAALISNRIDTSIDRAMHFTLGMSFKRIENFKRRTGRLLAERKEHG
jgi:hypothetical protein